MTAKAVAQVQCAYPRLRGALEVGEAVSLKRVLHRLEALKRHEIAFAFRFCVPWLSHFALNSIRNDGIFHLFF